jgi:hypothetical protein
LIEGQGSDRLISLVLFRLPQSEMLAGLPEHASDSLLDEFVLVVHQGPGQPEGIVQVVSTDEVEHDEYRGAALPTVLRTGKIVKDLTRLVEHIPPHHIPRAEVNQVPVVDPVMPAQVELAELPAQIVGRLAPEAW